MQADGAILVIGALFQLTENATSTPLLTSVFPNLDRVVEPGTTTTTGALDFTGLVDALHAGPLYHYQGSLTAPPCADGVTWLVLAPPLPLNVWTFNALKGVMKFNARYTQNTLGRTNLLELGAMGTV